MNAKEKIFKQLVKQLIKESVMSLHQEAPNRLPNRGRPPKKLANALAAINNAPFEDDDNDDMEDVGIKAPADFTPTADKRIHNFQKPLDPDYKSGDFDFNVYTTLQSPTARLQYVRNAAKELPGQFRRLGAGSSRIVYDMPGTGKVLKLALNNKGIAQNQAEIEITRRVHSVSPEYPLVTKIYGHDSSTEPTWLLAEGVKPIDYDSFAELTGMTWNNFYSFANNNFRSDAFNDNKFAMACKKTVQANKLELGDVLVSGHWGATEDGRVVMLDYGFTTDVANKHYRRGGNTKYFE